MKNTANKTTKASASERTPLRLANVAPSACQSCFDATVDCAGHERLLAIFTGGVDDEAAVGREARALVTAGGGQRSDIATGQFHHVQTEGPAHTRNVGQPATIRAGRGRNVVVASEGQ